MTSPDAPARGSSCSLRRRTPRRRGCSRRTSGRPTARSQHPWPPNWARGMPPRSPLASVRPASCSVPRWTCASSVSTSTRNPQALALPCSLPASATRARNYGPSGQSSENSQRVSSCPSPAPYWRRDPTVSRMRSPAERKKWRRTVAEYGTPPDVDRVAASRAAVAARRARAAVKAEVAAGERSPLDVLRVAGEEPASVEGGIRVTEFLTAIPSIGVTKMHRFMDELGISPAKRIGGLGRHQRRRLRSFLTERLAAQDGRSNRLVVLAGPTAVGKGTV